MRRLFGVCAIFVCLAVGTTAAADDREDVYSISGTAQEQHAQSIFTGVFGQCRPPAPEASQGVVALIFEVRPDGRFSATSTFKEDEGRDVLRSVSRCMGERANQARHFPKTSETQLVGVKYAVATEGKLLMLGAGEAETLAASDAFGWARKSPEQGGSS